MIQTTLFLADEAEIYATAVAGGGTKLFVPPPSSQRGQRKKYKKKVFATFKRKIILNT